MVLSVIFTAVIAYLLGNLNGALMISRLMMHDDVRSHGSGNAGLTNFIRNYGVRTAALVVLLNQGAAQISQNFDVSSAFPNVIVGIILFFIIGSEFFIGYELHFRKKHGPEAIK